MDFLRCSREGYIIANGGAKGFVLATPKEVRYHVRKNGNL